MREKIMQCVTKPPKLGIAVVEASMADAA